MLAGSQHIHSFRQQSGKVLVADADLDATRTAAAAPKFTGAKVLDFDGIPDRQCQIHSQSLDRNVSVGVLTTPLGRLAYHARRPMSHHDGGFDFVSVLTAGPATTSPFEIAVGQQLSNRQ